MKTNLQDYQKGSAKFNPVKNLKDETDLVMNLLVQIVGEDFSEPIKAKAREVVIAQTEIKSEVTMPNLVNAFDQVPELQDLSQALRKAALPGPFGRFFDGVPDIKNEPFILLCGPYDEPKSLLSKLNSQELVALDEWSKSQPRTEGGALDLMAWPGWAEVGILQAKSN